MCNSLKGLLHLNLVSWKGSFFRLLAKSLFLISEFGLAENVLGAAGWILLKAKSDFLIMCPLSNVTVCFVSDRGLPPSGLKYGSPPLLLTVLLNQLPPWLKGFDSGAQWNFLSTLSAGSPSYPLSSIALFSR